MKDLYNALMYVFTVELPEAVENKKIKCLHPFSSSTNKNQCLYCGYERKKD